MSLLVSAKKRIAVIDYELCRPFECHPQGYFCERVCPVNRTGKACISHEEGKQPIISEELCIGCKLCVKCPFNAITIINLEFEPGDPIHQYGANSFRLYRIPFPRKKSIIGLIGVNGIGKTTALNILSGQLTPNLGNYEEKADYSKVIQKFKGKEIQGFFEQLKNKEVKVSLKPQHIESLSKSVKGKVKDLLKKVDKRNKFEEVVKELNLNEILEREVKDLSGGELQRLAIAATSIKKADFYFFDEPTSYLDVKERLNAAKFIRSLAEEEKSVMVVEHDLAVLDYLTDYVHILHGFESAYGVVSNIKPSRNGINEFLEGFIKDEKLKFRAKEIKFEVRPPSADVKRKTLMQYPSMRKSFKEFSLEVQAGELKEGEVIGILGANAIGKTTFVKMLAGIIAPDEGELSWNARIAFKPQYLEAKKGVLVKELFESNELDKIYFETELKEKLRIRMLEEKELQHLSGGELQRVSIAFALARQSDLVLLDEPSAYLDVEQRHLVAKAIRVLAEKKDKLVMVVDHDIMFQDYVSDRLLVFEGLPGIKGFAGQALGKREGMNKFLSQLGVTFRRDPESGRARANKPGSVLDQEQKQKGEYYYNLD